MVPIGNPKVSLMAPAAASVASGNSARDGHEGSGVGLALENLLDQAIFSSALPASPATAVDETGGGVGLALENLVPGGATLPALPTTPLRG